MNSRSNLPLREVYEEFVFSRKVQGCTETTIQNYKDRIHNVSKYLDINMQLCKPVFFQSNKLDIFISFFQQSTHFKTHTPLTAIS